MDWVPKAIEDAKASLLTAEKRAEERAAEYEYARMQHEDAGDRVKQLDEVIQNLKALLVPPAETRVPL